MSLNIDWHARRAEAWALLRKGGLSASEPVSATGSSVPANGRAFLAKHGTV